MRRRNNVLDAVCGGNAAHFVSRFPGLWTIVYLRENMTMNVNHRLNFRQLLMEGI
jgi:hypothetical protein